MKTQSKHEFMELLKPWRWIFASLGIVFLLYWIITLPNNSLLDIIILAISTGLFFTIPGYFIILHLDLNNLERVLLSIPISIGFNVIILYYLNDLIGIRLTALSILLYLLVVLIASGFLSYHFFIKKTKKISSQPSNKKRKKHKL